MWVTCHRGIAEDWWSLLKSEWVDLGAFGL